MRFMECYKNTLFYESGEGLIFFGGVVFQLVVIYRVSKRSRNQTSKLSLMIQKIFIVFKN